MTPEQHTEERPFGAGFNAALVAGIVASAIMLLLSIFASGVSLPESVGSELTALMPLPLFEFLHRLIGDDAKHYLLVCVLIGQCLIFGLGGGTYALARARLQGRAGKVTLHFYDGLLLAGLLWLFAGLVVLPLSGSGLFGARLSIGMLNSMWSLAASGLVFGLLFPPCYRWFSASYISALAEREERASGRRALLRRGLILAGVGLVGVAAWRFITMGNNTTAITIPHFKSKVVPPPAPNYGPFTPVAHLSPEITPNDQYYVVSKNLVADPTVSSASWSLTIDGAVEHPYTLSYEELLALPMQRQYESMMCISNEVGGPYMSNALWEGVRLADLLERAGIKTGASKVAFSCVDNYSDSFHLSKALEPTTLLAVRMNGVPLPQEHGFPARLLVPGIYGMKHGKWVNHIQVVNYDFQGYWEQRGWSDEAEIRMTARIDTPLDGSALTAGSLTYIAGVAFSGNRGISEVDVSFDLGRTWQRAVLKRPLSPLTWVLWELPWRVPTRGGTYNVTARAIDLQGNVQDPQTAPPLPDGASGYHTITITVP
jgi:DMSO/TMAO reductase YedYZ molybdopterin-dependent catalytic subunit